MKKAIVIGGGVGGLSAAPILAREGFQVTVLEKNDFWGGRMRVFKPEGYTLDAGPSWYLMPEVFERYFGLFGKKTSDYYQLVKLDPSYRVFFEDGPTVDITTDMEQTKATFEMLEPGGAKKIEAYLKDAAYKYKVATEGFLYKDFRHITQFLNWRMMTEGLSLNVFDKLDHYAKRYFKTERARQILEYTMVFLGSSPFKTPALYSLMSHADISTGVFYPMGGFSKIADGFRKLGEELGVGYRLQAPVEKIISENGRVRGVLLAGGEQLEADVVVSNADYHHTETILLAPKDQSFSKSYWENRKWGPAMFKFCYALDKRVTGVSHHNLYFPRNWKEHFDSIDVHPDWPARPAFYLGSPSQTDRSLVPTPEGEILFFLVPISTELNDSEENRLRFREQVLDSFRNLLGQDVSGAKFQQICTISNCANYFNARHGTALGLAHTLGQTAVFRPHLRSKKLKGLYYTGQMTQPGIGVPMVVISGEIAAQAVLQDA